MRPILRRRAWERARAALRSADEALAALGAGGADLGPARRLRDRAEAHLRHASYRAAADAARTAEVTAKLLDRLHAASSKGIARLRTERGRMARLGMNATEVDGLLAAATSWMGRTVERNGDPAFPGYGKAVEFVLKGLKIAQERIPKFKDASAAVFEADRALRQLVESNRYVGGDAFQFFVLRPATDALEEAKSKLRANRFTEATGLARRTLAMARRVEERYGRVTEAYARVEEATRALRAEGGVAKDVEGLLEVCRTALERGKFDEAADIADQARRRLAERRDAYRSLVLGLRNAQDVISEVEGWGFDVREPRAILGDAQVLIDAGRYEDAGVRLEKARSSARGLRDTHRATAARIADLQRSVAAMRTRNPVAAAEADDLLATSEGLLDEGRYKACEENLQIASLLLAGPDPGGGPARPVDGMRAILDAARGVEPGCPICGSPLGEDETCATCGALATAENPPAAGIDPIQHAVDEARRVVEEIGREDANPIAAVAAEVQGCAMCGGPLGGEDILCAKCQASLKGRA